MSTRWSEEAPRADEGRGWLRSTVDWVIRAVLAVLVVLLVVTVAYPSVRGYVPLTILTGSMDPTYPPGSQVYVEPVEGADAAKEEVELGSVITFMPHPDDSTLVTHRVVEIAYDTAGEPVYTTQGDANNAPDEGTIGPTQLRGVVRYHVPCVGYLASSLGTAQKQQVGAALAAALFAYALWNLVAAVRERRRRE